MDRGFQDISIFRIEKLHYPGGMAVVGFPGIPAGIRALSCHQPQQGQALAVSQKPLGWAGTYGSGRWESPGGQRGQVSSSGGKGWKLELLKL